MWGNQTHLGSYSVCVSQLVKCVCTIDQKKKSAVERNAVRTTEARMWLAQKILDMLGCGCVTRQYGSVGYEGWGTCKYVCVCVVTCM